MHETEEVLPGEIEVETEHGRLLAHVDLDGDIVVTTGLDADRYAIGGRRYLVHVSCPEGSWRPTSIYIAHADDGTSVPDRVHSKIVGDVRHAIQGLALSAPDFDDEAQVRMRTLRTKGRKVIAGLLTREWQARQLEEAYREHPDVNCRTPPSYFLNTKWGPVRLVPGPNMMYATAGDGWSPHLTGAKGLFGGSRIEIKGRLRTDNEGKEVTVDRPFFVLEARTRAEVQDRELAEGIIESIRAGTAIFIRDNPGVMEEAWRHQDAQRTASLRSGLETVEEDIRAQVEAMHAIRDELRVAHLTSP